MGVISSSIHQISIVPHKHLENTHAMLDGISELVRPSLDFLKQTSVIFMARGRRDLLCIRLLMASLEKIRFGSLFSIDVETINTMISVRRIT